MEEYEVTSIGELVDAVERAAQHLGYFKFWWRGQANAKWGVTPSLYRKRNAAREVSMVYDFFNHARVRYAQAPPADDYSGWLCLMQHYGLPTRLLDWTLSVLAGLFFAVREKRYDKHDAVLWGLHPTCLNDTSVNDKRIMVSSSHWANNLFLAAWGKEQDDKTEKVLAIESQHVDILRKAFAIGAQHIDIRQMVQAAEFTIHGSDTPLNEFYEADQFMVRLNIPKAAKPMLRKYLDLFNITESYLFPDLQHLAKELKNRVYAS